MRRALSILVLAAAGCNPETLCEVDLDGDGYLSAASCPLGADALDCDDLDPEINPAAPELCNGADDDCDGATDEESIDFDGDGYAAAGCPADGSSPPGDDCDDTRPSVNPDAEEICDAVDNDCDGRIDEVDVDGDGHSPFECGGGDCDDSAPLLNPDVPEDCQDGIDNDCDGSTDFDDADADGFFSADCGGTDCDDAEPAINPSAAEVCDEIDWDCDGETSDFDFDGDGYADEDCGGDDCDDEDPTTNPGALDICTDGIDNDCDLRVDFQDGDGDGSETTECGGNDCDDRDPTTYLGADELCGDGIDNDCDGEIDDADLDRDSAISSGCPDGEDCDDLDPQIHPTLPEYCDGTDRNCDGSIVDDRDEDGFSCDSDCNDALPDVHPGASEGCDGVDDDCDGRIDEGYSGACDQGLPGGMDLETGAYDWDPDGVRWVDAGDAIGFNGADSGQWDPLVYADHFLSPPWTFTADVTRLAGEGDSKAGIYISGDTSGGNDGYYLVVYQDTRVRYEIGRLIGGEPSPEKEDRFALVVMPGEGLANRLEIQHTGIQIRFRINGQTLHSDTVSDTLSKGYPALLVYDAPKDGLTARFDNLYAGTE